MVTGVAEESRALDPVAAKKLIDRVRSAGGEVLVVDVRAEAEYAHSHIPGALNLSIREETDVAEKLSQRGVAKDMTLLVYSGSGTRSKRMVTALLGAGYTRVYGLDKGLGAWESEGFPIERIP